MKENRMRLTIASYGAGTNSTAMLIGMALKGDPAPHAILFADTDGERPETYAFVDTFSDWLEHQQYPRITTVRVTGEGLEENCLRRKALPSVAYGGFKTCSQRWKTEPQEKWCNNDPACKTLWNDGGLVTKLIGFDADEPQRGKPYKDKKFINRYPLLEWDWGRDECIQAIQDCQLMLPGKSSCFFCPNMKADEIKTLEAQHPDLMARALAMENGADLTNIKGLGRDWTWASLLRQGHLFPEQFNRRVNDMPCGCYDG